ncbi:MAG TPA: M20 family metallopeptidase [Candidatus Dormibacteraeota bacterium]|jgi:glutamate carboxypeptidase|nr:M20 family metallopeptidase [Candidatus Dormibacteraeota bacterium]
MDDTPMQRPDRTAMLAALERLVRAESPSPDKARCDGCADEVTELFRERTGVTAVRHRRSSAGDHLEIRIGDGAQPIVVLCHHDTVWPEGTLARLPYRIDGDRVTGPGSYDMKAGIVETAFALEQARPKRPVVVLSTSDEEIGSASSRALIEETARQAVAVLVLEPAASGGAIKTARKGIADFVLEVGGRAAHAGVEPEKGISAIEELAHQVLALKALAQPASGTTVNVGVVHGGTRPNVVAAQARAEVDVRFTRASEAERIVAAIQGLRPRLQGAQLRISGGVDRPPMERGPGVVRLAQLAQRLAGDVGFSLTETSTGGASDGNFTAAMGVPTLDGLGPDGGGAHADTEHLLVESWLQRTQLLRLLIEAL